MTRNSIIFFENITFPSKNKEIEITYRGIEKIIILKVEFPFLNFLDDTSANIKAKIL